MTRHIFIKFALAGGVLLTTAGNVFAQDANPPTGYFTLGAAYSERYGETAFASISDENFLGSGVGIGAAAEYTRTGYRISANLDTGFTLPMPGNLADALLDVSVYMDERAWQGAAYSTKRTGLDLGLTLPFGQNTTLTAGYFLYDDVLSNVAANTSPLVALEAGQKLSSGVQAGLYFDNTDTPVRPTRGISAGFTARYAGLGGDSKWSNITASGTIYQPVPMNGVASIGISAGHMQSLDGQPVRITDRAFLGYDLPRGFAYGGLGPRDVAGATNTPLGGENYATASVSADFPILETRTGTLYGGIFWEAGSVWNLQNTTGAAMGTVDAALYWRASYGVSLSWAGAFGQLRLSWADPYLRKPYDVAQPLSLTFSTSF